VKATPLPQLATTFRATASLSLPVELTSLLSAISKRGINVSRGLERPIRAWAVKTAREMNKKATKVRGLPTNL
jgi:hypothetical protein